MPTSFNKLPIEDNVLLPLDQYHSAFEKESLTRIETEYVRILGVAEKPCKALYPSVC